MERMYEEEIDIDMEELTEKFEEINMNAEGTSGIKTPLLKNEPEPEDSNNETHYFINRYNSYKTEKAKTTSPFEPKYFTETPMLSEGIKLNLDCIIDKEKAIKNGVKI